MFTLAEFRAIMSTMIPTISRVTSLAMFTLAEFRAKMLAIMPAITQLTYFPWPNEMNRNDPIYVVPPKVAKASKEGNIVS
jgi:hypothetical protein